MMREEVLASVARIGGRLGELRLDTDLDISHGVVRYLELLKLVRAGAAPGGAGRSTEALADINARLLAATTPLQREIFQTSALDELLTERSPERWRRRRWRASRPRRRRSDRTTRIVPAPARRRSRRAKPPRSGPSCRARGSAWRCRPRTSRPTAAVRCATSSRASCASRPSRRRTSASGSSCTRCSSATTPARRDARAAARAARAELAAQRLRHERRARARAARQGARRAHALPRAPARPGLRAGVVRAPVLLPARAAPPARPRRPRRPARGRRRARSTS